MANRKFTAEQLEAIHEQGGQILVAAAAGSGKTSVLVERLYQQLLGAKVQDLNHFLIITFTNDAASELKERISKRLKTAITELQNETSNRETLRLIVHLQKQISLLPQANVSTIHGFCGKLLRDHGHLIGINPGFIQMNEEEKQIIQEEVLDLTLQHWYRKNNPDFIAMVDYFSGERTDSQVETTILSLYSQIQSEAKPMEWLKHQKNFWDTSTLSSASPTEIDQYLRTLPWIQGGLASMLSEMNELIDDMTRFIQENQEFPQQVKKGQESLDDYKNMLSLLEQALSPDDENTPPFHWDNFIDGFHLKQRNGTKLSAGEKPRNKTRLALDQRMRHLLLWKPRKEMMDDITNLSPHMITLLDVVESFDQRFRKEKDRRNMLDFGDLEHFAVTLLVDSQGKRSPLAESISRQFEEVMVDEYQDTNIVQNTIFSAVARQDEQGQEQNLFFVGDVKQSIYSFRLADPSIFARHFKNFSKTKGIYPRAILLRRNFRSRHSVINACNDFFRVVMSEKFGQTNYEKDGMLQQAGIFPVLDDPKDPEPSYHLDFDVLDCSGYDLEHLAGGKNHLEAKWIAKRIKDLVDSKFQVKHDDTSTRDITYGDILILIRSPKGLTHYYEQAMSELEIPFLSAGGENIFTSTEVSVALSLLKVIDNPLQDVPLVSVLRSPLFRFSNDELVLLRQGEGRYFYHSLLSLEDVSCFEKDSPQKEGTCTHPFCDEIRQQILPSLLEKTNQFLKLLDEFRQKSWEMDSEELLWYVMERTNILGIFGAMIQGEERQTRLLEFHRIIGQYREETLFSTLKKLEDLSKIKALPQVSLGQIPENVVELKTVHMAKGLEKPVVIVANLDKKYNMQSMKDPLLVHSTLGFGPRLYEESQRYFKPMLAGEVLRNVKTRDMVSEELRLMYVAMTRAQEKLILSLPLTDALSTLEDVGEELSLPLQSTDLIQKRTMGDILLAYAMSRKDSTPLWEFADMDISDYFDEEVLEEQFALQLSHWNMKVIDCGASLSNPSPELPSLTEESDTAQPIPDDFPDDFDDFDDLGYDSSWWEGLEEICRQRYAYDFYRQESEIPSKFTATQLKGRPVVSSVLEDASDESLQEPVYAYLEEDEYTSLMDEYLSIYDHDASYHQVIDESYDPDFQEPVHTHSTAGEMYPPELSIEERKKRERHPQFLQENEKVLSPSQRGDAIHIVMQYLSLTSLAKFSPQQLPEEIRNRLEQLVSEGKITEQQRAVINERQIMCFLQSDWGKNAIASSLCQQEFKFSILVSGTQLGYDTAEPLLLQGVIDCWYESAPNEIVIIDFKSGRVPLQIPDILNKKAKEHETQMAVYAMALNEITEKKVVKKVLWFFEADCGVEVLGEDAIS